MPREEGATVSSTIHRPPVTEQQRALLARLVTQGRVTLHQLREAGVASMNRAELAAWLDQHVLGTQPDEATHGQVEALFEEGR